MRKLQVRSDDLGRDFRTNLDLPSADGASLPLGHH
jgi:hypothetical protein